MIQVNLIPDLKAEFLKAQRTKNFVMSIAFIVAAGFIGLVVFMSIYVYVWQKQHSDNLEDHIGRLTTEYQENQDLGKIVTVQKQLEQLPLLHAEKPLIARTPQILSVITPEDPEKPAGERKIVTLRSIDFDFETNTMIISGNADTVLAWTQFVNSVKNAKYYVLDDIENELPAFSNVISNSLGNDDEGASFELTFEFDPQIFLIHDEVTLYVPEIDSTQSALEAPNLDEAPSEDVPLEGGDD